MKMVQYAVKNNDDRLRPQEIFVIFARTKTRADEIFHLFLKYDLTPLGWRGDEWERHVKHGNAVDLHSVMSGDQEGLGLFVDESGWLVVTPDMLEEE